MNNSTSPYAAAANTAPVAFPPGLLSTLNQTLETLNEVFNRIGSVQDALGQATILPAPTSAPPAPGALGRTNELMQLANRLNDAVMQIQNAL